MNIIVDTGENALIFELAGSVIGEGTRLTAPAYLDIGERGRLVSLDVEFDDRPPETIALTHESSGLSRTARVDAECEIAPDGRLLRVTVPRRGQDYELSFPSGNECWIGPSGAVTCAITRS